MFWLFVLVLKAPIDRAVQALPSLLVTVVLECRIGLQAYLLPALQQNR